MDRPKLKHTDQQIIEEKKQTNTMKVGNVGEKSHGRVGSECSHGWSVGVGKGLTVLPPHSQKH